MIHLGIHGQKLTNIVAGDQWWCRKCLRTCGFFFDPGPKIGHKTGHRPSFFGSESVFEKLKLFLKTFSTSISPKNRVLGVPRAQKVGPPFPNRSQIWPPKNRWFLGTPDFGRARAVFWAKIQKIWVKTFFFEYVNVSTHHSGQFPAIFTENAPRTPEKSSIFGARPQRWG